MKEFISYAEKKGCSYIELKSQEGIRNTIEVVDKDIKELSQNESALYSVRVIFNGSEGLSYSNKNDFKEMIEKAIKLARIQDKKINFYELKSENIKLKTKCKIDLESINLEEKKNNIINLLKSKKNYKQISGVKFIYRDVKSKFNYVNNEGRNIFWEDSAVDT